MGLPIEHFDDESSGDGQPQSGPRTFRGNRLPVSHFDTTRLLLRHQGRGTSIVNLGHTNGGSDTRTTAEQDENRFPFVTDCFYRTGGTLILNEVFGTHIFANHVPIQPTLRRTVAERSNHEDDTKRPTQFPGVVPASNFLMLSAEVEALEQQTAQDAYWRTVNRYEGRRATDIYVAQGQVLGAAANANSTEDVDTISATTSHADRAKEAVEVVRQALQDLRIFASSVAVRADDLRRHLIWFTRRRAVELVHNLIMCYPFQYSAISLSTASSDSCGTPFHCQLCL
jgi:hypothetical protein